jgi:hypothetical protein
LGRTVASKEFVLVILELKKKESIELSKVELK